MIKVLFIVFILFPSYCVKAEESGSEFRFKKALEIKGDYQKSIESLMIISLNFWELFLKSLSMCDFLLSEKNIKTGTFLQRHIESRKIMNYVYYLGFWGKVNYVLLFSEITTDPLLFEELKRMASQVQSLADNVANQHDKLCIIIDSLEKENIRDFPLSGLIKLKDMLNEIENEIPIYEKSYFNAEIHQETIFSNFLTQEEIQEFNKFHKKKDN